MRSYFGSNWWVEPDVIVAVPSSRDHVLLLVSNDAHILVVMVNNRVGWSDVLRCGLCSAAELWIGLHRCFFGDMLFARGVCLLCCS